MGMDAVKDAARDVTFDKWTPDQPERQGDMGPETAKLRRQERAEKLPARSRKPRTKAKERGERGCGARRYAPSEAVSEDIG